MIGAIAGDIIGSVHEWRSTKSSDFRLMEPGCFFTDDTVLTVAVADCILNGGDYAKVLQRYTLAYPGRGYGGHFSIWALSEQPEPYDSWGNGSAMRVSPVGFALDTLEDVLAEARRTAEPTHSHPEGIKGAQATAAAIFLARSGEGRAAIQEYVEARFGYDLGRSLEEIRPGYRFDVSCRGSVPESIIAFLESEDWESAVRNAISLGGDADTMACITGGIAEAFYGGVPGEVRSWALDRLDDRLREVAESFCERFGL